MRIEERISPADLHDLFDLKEDGTLVWRARPGSSRGALCFNGRFAGTIAGSRLDPTRHIEISITLEDGLNFKVKAHRVVMAMVDGEWPPIDKDVDHIDGDPHNNRRSNLRICTRTENAQNMKLMRSNRAGFKGVRFHPTDKVWHARIRASGTPIHLGSFRSAEDAARAYDEAAVKHHGEFARTNAAMGLL